jgi:hypothetical protein
MDNRTFFKTPSGGIYSISEKIVAMGHEPAEGVVPATEEDLEAHKQQREVIVDKEAKIAALQELAENELILGDYPQRLLEGLHAQDAAVKEKADKEAALIAEEEARQKRIADKLQAREAAVEAKRQAAIKAEEEAAAEAQRLAALEPSTPRRFSAA